MQAVVCEGPKDYHLERVAKPVTGPHELIVRIAACGKETSAAWSIIGDRKALDVRGAHLGPHCYPVVIDLMQRGLLTSRGTVSHAFTRSEWERAFAPANSLDSIKVLLKP